MRWERLTTGWALFLGAVAALVGVAVVGVAVFVSGVYHVGASTSHFDVTNTVIKLALRRSVAFHSTGIEPPDLSSREMAALGARHFEMGCAPCHGSPGASQSPVVEEMYPSPPRLSERVPHWDTEELYWIVRHGFKFTGMPAWPGEGREEEVWPVVAFLKRLPQMKPDDYADLAAKGEDAPSIQPLAMGPQAGGGGLAAACDACHGRAGKDPVYPLVPSLSGQKAAYIERSLRDYAADRRQSGMMETVAERLTPQSVTALARVYSARPRPGGTRTSKPDDAAVARGERIFTQGIPEDGIPACTACHSSSTSGQFPLLSGLPADYIATQLELFSSGVREDTVYAQIMAPIARRLDEEQIADVAAYLSARLQPVSGEASTETQAREQAR